MKAKGLTSSEKAPIPLGQPDALRLETGDGVRTIEMSGVLVSRMIHELTNHLTVVAGNLQVVEMAPEDPDLVRKALESVRLASVGMTEVVERYAGFRRQLRNDSLGCDPSDFANLVMKGPPPEPFQATGQNAGSEWWADWKVTAPTPMQGWLPIEARWINHAIWRVAALSGSPSGEIRFFPPGSNPDLQGVSTLTTGNRLGNFLHISISWKGDKSSLDRQELHKPSTLALAVVIGLVRWVDGQVGVVFLPPDENRFWIFLPMERRKDPTTDGRKTA